MTPNEAPAATNPYTLSSVRGDARGATLWAALRRLAPLLAGERQRVIVAFVSTLVASGTALMAPVIIGRAVDTYIRNRDFAGVLRSAGMLLAAYVVGLIATY